MSVWATDGFDAEIVDMIEFLKELRKETDRGLALVSAAVVDEKLAHTLAAFFCDNGTARRILGMDPRREAALSTLSARADTAFALGLIERHEYDEIGIIRKIRNEFAHARHGLKFETPEIAKLCSKLKSDLPPGATKPAARERFHFAVVFTFLRLYSRPKHVASERRQPRAWLPEGRVAWDSDPNSNAVTITFDNGETFSIDFGAATTTTPSS